MRIMIPADCIAGVFQMEGELFLWLPYFCKNNLLKRTDYCLIAAIIWLLTTTLLLCLPGNDLPDISWIEQWHIDKLIHIILFFGWVFLFANTIADYRKRLRRMVWIVLAGIAYGILIEFIQKYWIPHRSFDVDDMVADAAGCLLAWLWQRKK